MKIKRFGGTIPISGPRSKTVDDGLILVGDLAGLLRCSRSSHLALWSGRDRHVLSKAMKKASSAKALTPYEQAW